MKTSQAGIEAILRNIVTPALQMLPKAMDSEPARVMLLAIGMQESRLTYRRQIGGPARGLWQFEEGGGVKGVLEHHTTHRMAEQVCIARGVTAERKAVYAALEHDDLLAAAFARLLLWTDPKALPTTENGAWALYARVWRPGKPHPETWPAFFQAASQAVHGS